MRNTLLLIALLAATPLAASANETSYTYVEGGYARLNIDDSETSNPGLDGGYLRGSFAVGEQVHLFGGYGHVSNDFNIEGADVELTVKQAEFGVGYHMPFTERVDFTADIAYLRQEIEAEASFGGVRASDEATSNGGRATLGLRGKPSARTEAWIKAGYIDGGDFEGDFVGTLGGQIKFNQTWGIVGEVELIEDSTQYLVGIRASF
jgi:hypothetical protein